MDMLNRVLNIIFHLDKYLGIVITHFGYKAYIIIFIIVFLESGIILTPFLPGNSLIFITGTFAALKSINIYVLIITLLLASIFGGIINYNIGKFFGAKIIKSKIGVIIEKKGYFDKTKLFYEKQGGRTLIMARYIPVVRTFSPFIAGVSNVGHMKFMLYNILGAFLWVIPLNLLGYWFGNLTFVRNNYSIVIFMPIIGYVVFVFFAIIIRKLKKKLSNA
ncbi:VTT domain-containing protein [Hathewaya histolytica]|uniref:DedA family membrane protein n=2 Tax=Hathewaya histolytica TaxID=1498 RepID=A0A4U9QZC2_HATHI|nr:DedA family membrane protein [Hathewaya histolytica]